MQSCAYKNAGEPKSTNSMRFTQNLCCMWKCIYTFYMKSVPAFRITPYSVSLQKKYTYTYYVAQTHTDCSHTRSDGAAFNPHIDSDSRLAAEINFDNWTKNRRKKTIALLHTRTHFHTEIFLENVFAIADPLLVANFMRHNKHIYFCSFNGMNSCCGCRVICVAKIYFVRANLRLFLAHFEWCWKKFRYKCIVHGEFIRCHTTRLSDSFLLILHFNGKDKSVSGVRLYVLWCKV